MQRSKALIASALVAASLTVGASIYVAGSGLLAGATDNVGNLQPTVATTASPSTPQEITVYVDPVTGTATTIAPQPVPAEASPTDATAPAEDAIDRTGDDGSEDDRGSESESQETEDDD